VSTKPDQAQLNSANMRERTRTSSTPTRLN